ncbi:MAG: RNA polymerase sigma factor [Myxococcota bacterium]
MKRAKTPRRKTVTGEHLDAEALYRAHADFVARFLMRLGARGQDVPDLIQEVFLVAHRRGGFVPDRAKPTTWLAEISFRVFSDRRKKSRRKLEDFDTESVIMAPSQASSPAERTEKRQALARVQTALNTLTPEKRAVFILYELEGESCDVIAQGLGIPVGTVYSRLHSARREFARVHERLVEETPSARELMHGAVAGARA